MRWGEGGAGTLPWSAGLACECWHLLILRRLPFSGLGSAGIPLSEVQIEISGDQGAETDQ